MDKKIILTSIILQVFAILLLSNIVAAQTSGQTSILGVSAAHDTVMIGNVTISPPSNQSIIGLGHQLELCRTSLIANEVNAVAAVVPNLSYLRQTTAQLQLTVSTNSTNANVTTNYTNKTTISGLSPHSIKVSVPSFNGSSGNLSAFSAAQHQIYDPQITAIKNRLVSGISAPNVSNATRKELKTTVSNLRLTYINCTTPPVKNLTNTRLQEYLKVIAAFNKQIATLSAKGVNTTNMTLVIQGAIKEIILPLEGANGTTTTGSTALLDALNKYCLFNGCKNGINYHLDAKFSIAKLFAIDVKAQSYTNDTAGSANLTKAQLDLSAASTELALVGNSTYGSVNGSKTIVWSNITAAQKLLKGVLNHHVKKFKAKPVGPTKAPVNTSNS